MSLSWFIGKYRFPDFAGWNPYFFGGFPQGTLYPPLFHYLVAGFSKFFRLSISYKLVITISAAFIPYTIYEFSLKVYKEKSWSLLTTILILLVLVILPGYLGFNFDGIFDYGLGPSFMTIPMFFAYLSVLFSKVKNMRPTAILLCLLLLSNLVAFSVAAMITFVYFIIGIRNYKTLFTRIAKLAFIFLSLSAFWLIPFIYFYSYTASGYPMKSNLYISIFALLLIIFILFTLSFFRKRIEKHKELIAVLIPNFIVSILSVVDSLVNSQETKISIPPIHPFRLLIFAYLACLITIPAIIKVLHPIFIKLAGKLKMMKFIKRDIHIGMNLFSLGLLLLLLTMIRLNPKGVDSIMLKQKLNWDGRVMRAYKVSEVLDQSRAVIDKSVMRNPQHFAVDGLLKESSYLAPYFQSLSKSIDPDNFDWESLDSYYIENQQIPIEKAKFLMDLLWVKSIFAIKRDFPNSQHPKHISYLKSNSLKEGIVDRNIYLLRYTPAINSSFIEVVSKKPKTISKNWDEALEEWFFTEEIDLFTNKELHIVDFKKNPKLDYKFSHDFQELTIYSDHNGEIPILVKMSYFPKWKAYDMKGEETAIIRTAPNLMIVNVDEKTTLRYERTKLETTMFIFSFFGWIIVGLSFIFPTKYLGLKKQISKQMKSFQKRLQNTKK